MIIFFAQDDYLFAVAILLMAAASIGLLLVQTRRAMRAVRDIATVTPLRLQCVRDGNWQVCWLAEQCMILVPCS